MVAPDSRAPLPGGASLFYAVPLRIGWGPEDAERLKRKRAELAEAEGKVRSLRKLLSEREAQAARR